MKTLFNDLAICFYTQVFYDTGSNESHMPLNEMALANADTYLASVKKGQNPFFLYL